MALYAKTDSNSSQEMSQAGESLEARENFLTYQTLTNVGHCVLQTYGASPMNIQQRRSVAIWTGRPNQQIQRFTRTIRFVHWKVMKLKTSILLKNVVEDLMHCMFFQNAMMVLSWYLLPLILSLFLDGENSHILAHTQALKTLPTVDSYVLIQTAASITHIHQRTKSATWRKNLLRKDSSNSIHFVKNQVV